MRSLPIGPEEAFVLTRVDGRSSEADIAASTGLDAARVRESLERLVELGAVSFPDGDSSPPPRSVEPSGVSPAARLAHPVIEAQVQSGGGPQPPAALYDPAELDEQVDLDLPRKRKILDYYYRLDNATHYELLGLGAEATRKDVRNAYFEIVATFHPDRYFGKNLGSFKSKLDRVFQRLTEASDVLSRPHTRNSYDAYLESQRRTKNLEQAMADEQARLEELEEARRRIEQDARIAERASHQQVKTTTWPPPSDPDARKRALARRLRGSMNPPKTATTSSQPPEDRAALKERVAEDLKRRFESRLSAARESQVKKYEEAAEAALASNDVVSAANALRIASSLAPDDAELKTRLDDVQSRADALLSETYLEQAKYEEANRHWLAAAQSYERALRSKSSAVLCDRVATCLLEGDGDMKKAGEFARKAVALATKAVDPRITLAKVYVKAGMKESALAEFERASQMAPHDETIKDWIKRIKKGEV
jgi:curved DNA-binding protein CbpA